MDGYKSYAVAVAIVVVSVLHALGYVDRLTFEGIIGVLLGASVATLRHGMDK